MKVRLGDYIQECSDRNRKSEEIPVYSVTNAQGFCRDYFGKEVASKDKSTYKIVPYGCFAYNPSRINVGSVDWQHVQDRVIVSPLYVVFSISEKILPQYLYYYLKSSVSLSYINNSTTGSVRDSLKFTALSEFPFELRPISIQQHIVEQLDMIRLIISKQQEALETLDNLIKARFVEMFGNCAIHEELGNLSTLITKGSSPRWQGIDYTESGVLFITSENVREGYIDYSKRKYLDERINNIQPRSILKKDDILINIVGASIGRAAVFTENISANINQAVALVRLKPNCIDLTYLITYLNSGQAMKAYKAMKKGGARDNLSLENISSLHIPLAPYSSQVNFSSFATQVNKSKAAVQSALDKAQLLFDSLMQKYFG